MANVIPFTKKLRVGSKKVASPKGSLLLETPHLVENLTVVLHLASGLVCVTKFSDKKIVDRITKRERFKPVMEVILEWVQTSVKDGFFAVGNRYINKDFVVSIEVKN